MGRSFNALPKTEQSKRLAIAYNALSGSYIPSIQNLLFNRGVLPYLEPLDWEDNIALQPLFYDAIANSTIQNLKLYRVRVDKLFIVSPPRYPLSGSWPLRSLHLETIPAMSNIDLNVSRLCTSLLQIRAPNLQSLTWTTCNSKSLHTNGLNFIARFPSLRHLRIAYLDLADDCLIQLLVQNELKSLDIDIDGSSACTESIDRRNRIPAFKNFVCSSSNLPESQSLTFLEANPQIIKLNMPLAASAKLLEDRILPLLPQSLSNLTSLSLVWDSLKIPDQAMEHISQIATLEQLHLSAGN